MSFALTQLQGFNATRAGQVAFLLFGGGTDEVAATTDSSPFAHTINFNNSAGSAVIDTAQYVGGGNFPNSSLRVDGTIDSSIGYTYWADHPIFSLGSKNWTMELFYRHNGASVGTTTRYMAGQVDATGATTNSSMMLSTSPTKFRGDCYSGGASAHNGGAALAGTSTLTGNTWYYGCYCRDGDTFRLYHGVPGGSAVQEASVAAASSGIILNDSTANWGLGRAGDWPTLAWYNLNGSPNVGGWFGWLAPARLTVGRCLYPGGTTYAVPTSF